MAKVQNTLIGRASGSVGGATFTTWKGINVLKSKPESVANPNTSRQQAQRNRLSVIVAVFRLIASYVNVGFKSRAVGKSEYNAFVSENIVNATSTDGANEASIDYDLLAVSRGTIGKTEISGIAEVPATNNITVNYDDSVPVGGALSDKAYCLIYSEGSETWSIAQSEATRQDGTMTVTMDSANQIGSNLHVYLFFKSANDNDVSDNAYLEHLPD